MATKNRNHQTADRSESLGKVWKKFVRRWKSDDDLANSSVGTYRHPFNLFREWMALDHCVEYYDDDDLACDGDCVDCQDRPYDLSDVGPTRIADFSPWVAETNDFTQSTLESYSTGLQTFLQYCEDTNRLPDGTVDGHITYSATDRERQWDEEIDYERAERIVSWMQDHFPHHRDTVILTILLRTGMRKSGLRGIDLEDIQVRADRGPVIRLKERDGTPLKGKRGKHERVVNIKQSVYDRILEYVDNHRHDVTDSCDDDCGECDTCQRRPLITTRFGRASNSTIRDAVYKWTCPQHTGVGDCSCESKPNTSEASKCDESISPHGFRAAHVTYLKDEGVPYDHIGGRVGCEPDTLKAHYDNADKEQESQRRHSLLDDL